MANIFSLIIGCIITFLPLYTRFSSLNIDRVSKAVFLLLLIPIFLMFKNEKQRILPIEIRIGLITCVLHTILFQYEPASFSGIFQSIALSLGMLFFVKYHENYKSEEIILNSLVVSSLIQCVISTSQYAGFDLYSNAVLALNKDIILQTTEKSFFGSFSNSNLFGSYLALCLPSFYRKKVFYFAPIILLFVFLSKSLMAIAAVVAGLILFWKKGLEKYLYIGFPFLIAIGIYLFPSEASGRIELWWQLINKIDFSHFIIGKSVSWFDYLELKIGSNFINNEHNEFLSAFNIFGIFGLLFFLYLFIKVIKNVSKNHLFGCIALSSFVNMLGNFPLHYAPLAIIVIISIAHCIKGDYVSNLDR